ncbi:MAG: DUF6456 domain-containing protein [Ruegeria sp.]
MENSMAFTVPAWVPEGAQRYLAHTEAGRSIRDLARSAGCHASTVLRQIRRIEMRRDDPLVDAALQTLADAHFPPLTRPSGEFPAQIGRGSTEDALVSGNEEFERQSLRVLRRMCEPGAVLAVAEDMDKAVVVRDGDDNQATKTAVVESAIAQALALKDWISCDSPGRISRYRITTAGRCALGQLIAQAENQARAINETGFAEPQSTFNTRGDSDQTACNSATDTRRMRYSATDSPLISLARRRDRDGEPFLKDSLVRAGERLREDFELAQIGPHVAQNWDRFLTGRQGQGGAEPFVGNGAVEARDRLTRALSELGPGLSDITIRCCCHLEGLEQAEKRMGWSARSAKIVLRIALQRLRRHYDEQEERDAMIG